MKYILRSKFLVSIKVLVKALLDSAVVALDNETCANVLTAKYYLLSGFQECFYLIIPCFDS